MANEIGTSRRAFIAASAGAAAAGSVLPALESAAQSTAPLKIVDFHNHYMGIMDVEECGPACPPRHGRRGKEFTAICRATLRCWIGGIGRHRGARDQYANRVY